MVVVTEGVLFFRRDDTCYDRSSAFGSFFFSFPG